MKNYHSKKYKDALNRLVEHVSVDQYYTPTKATKDVKLLETLIKESSYYLDSDNINELFKYLKEKKS